MSENGQQVVAADEAIKTFVERRRKRRIQVSIPIIVKGADYKGNPFAEATESIDFSATGTCFLLGRRLKVGSTVELSISLPPDTKIYKTVGFVTRVEDNRQPQAYKFAVKFNHIK